MDDDRRTLRPGRGRLRTRLLSSLLWASALLLTAAGGALSVANGLNLTELFAHFLATNMAVAATFATAGAAIVAQRPENRVGWLLGVTGLLSACAVFLGPYARFALLTRPGELPGGPLAAWLNHWIWTVPVVLAALVLPLLFPTGRLPSPRWRPVGATVAAAGLLLVVVVAAAPEPDASLPEVRNPLPFEATRPLVAASTLLLGPLLVVAIAGALAAVVVRFRRSRGDERRQLAWFAYAVGSVLAVSLVPVLLRLAGANVSGTTLLGALQAVVLPLVPAAVAVAVLRYRLYEIDVLVQRTLVYGGLSLSVAALYVVVVGYLGAVFRSDGQLLVSLFATGLVAVAFQPLREHLQQAVNRLLYGQRDEPYVAISRLAGRLEMALAPEAVLTTIVETVREALRLPYAAVALVQGGERTPVAVSGKVVPDPLRLPLSYQGESVGELLVGRRVGERDFSPADRLLLTDLARQCGVAVHAVTVTADLRRSRERVVAAREEERRRLRRELHDGLGPRLAGLTLRLETARDRLAGDAVAQALLADLAERTRDAVTDVRRVVHGLRPPALDDLGLVPTLRETAARIVHDGGPRVEVVAPDALPALSAGVEAAAYCIVQEALTNVLRHASATRCVVRLVVDDDSGGLGVEVHDDGVGVPAQRRSGVGLASMRERAEELGGTFTLQRSPDGGTSVAVLLPPPAQTAGRPAGLEVLSLEPAGG